MCALTCLLSECLSSLPCSRYLYFCIFIHVYLLEVVEYALNMSMLFIFLGFEFFETSAKDNINVKQTFERLVDIICDKMSESLETDPTIAASKQNTRLKDTPPPQQPNCGC